MRISPFSIFPLMASPEAETVASRRTALERFVARDQLIVAGCLAALVGLGWWWLLRAAGMAMGLDPWSAAYLLPAFAMWTLMMVAMMLPSAAPMILLHAHFAARLRSGLKATALFTAAYAAVWTIFSAAATLSQAALVSAGAVSAMELRFGAPALAGATLLIVGLWQLSPVKSTCLDRCRSPLSFLTHGWRRGLRGAFRLGLSHGAYCLGCCWALMLLLFVGGVMSPAWMAGLTLLVAFEKLAPLGAQGARLLAFVAILAGLFLLSAF